jgi:hypothetical protein
LRKVICEPVVSQRQQKISKAISDGIKEKRGSSIVGLKSLFQQKGQQEAEEDSQDEDEMEEDHEEEAEAEEKAPERKSKRVQDKFKEKKLINSKPKMTKKLVWF